MKREAEERQTSAASKDESSEDVVKVANQAQVNLSRGVEYDLKLVQKLIDEQEVSAIALSTALEAI